jgi:hypothetical protein
LRQFYNSNAEHFSVEPRLSFTQIFFNPERRRHAETDAEAALVLISTVGGDDRAKTMGDPTLLETEFQMSIPRRSPTYLVETSREQYFC